VGLKTLAPLLGRLFFYSLKIQVKTMIMLPVSLIMALGVFLLTAHVSVRILCSFWGVPQVGAEPIQNNRGVAKLLGLSVI
jgi:hypothetical protein